MEILIKQFNVSGLEVKASGRLDLDNAVKYGTTIKDAILDSYETITELVLDFSEITFLSSFGLKVILELYKEIQGNQGEVKIKNAPEQIVKSFKLVGFDKFLVFV